MSPDSNSKLSAIYIYFTKELNGTHQLLVKVDEINLLGGIQKPQRRTWKIYQSMVRELVYK
jgi:hypothetical protein